MKKSQKDTSPMALYPTETIALAEIQAQPMTLLNSSSALVVPITIAPLAGYSIATAQLSPTQDYSIRMWLSQTPTGNFVPTHASFWYLARYDDQQIVFYDLAGNPVPTPVPPCLSIFPVPVIPGNYFLNFLNLVNAENVFSFFANPISFP